MIGGLDASGVVETLLATLFGALAGAYFAHRIDERSRQSEKLMNELNATNFAISFVANITNTFLRMKGQHVHAMMKQFSEQQLLYHYAVANNQPVAIAFDFNTLERTQIPTEALEKRVFDILSLEGRGMHLTITLMQTIVSVDAAIQQRNRLIEGYMASFNTLTPEQKVALYFGLSTENGFTDANYPSSVLAIYKFVDDGIAFSLKLAEDLTQHSVMLAARYRAKFRGDVPPPPVADYSRPDVLAMMPDMSSYADWERAFVKRPKRVTRWERAKAALRAEFLG